MRMCRRILAVLSMSFLLAPAIAVADDGRLVQLVKAQGVSGFERDVRDQIAGMLPVEAGSETMDAC